MNKTAKITILALFLSLPCLAQYDQKSMYKCYLSNNKALWKKYITSTNWETIDNTERQRLLNYEYGYIAYAISSKDKDAKQLLQAFNAHIAEMKDRMPEATRLTYLAGAYSYQVSLNKITILSNGPKIFKYADQAVKLDGNNPYALALRGSIYFYCPHAFGGDKQKAMQYLNKAEQQYRIKGDTIENWNYRAVQTVIVQCYENTGNKQTAIDKCYLILQEEPDFAYIRDCYLPELLGIKKADAEDPNNPGAAFVSSID